MSRPLALVTGVTCLGLAAVTAYHARPPEAVSSLPAAQPTLEINPEVYDFGETVQGKSLAADIGLVNRTPDAIEIGDVILGCSCTDVSLTDKHLAPGGRSELRLTWHVGTLRGPISESVRVYWTVAGGEPKSRLVKLRALVRPDIDYEPRVVVFNAKSTEPRVVRFKPGRLDRFTLNRVVVDHPGYAAKLDAATNEVVVTVDPSVPGIDEGRIRLIVECDSPVEPRMEIPIVFERSGQ